MPKNIVLEERRNELSTQMLEDLILAILSN